MQSFIPPKLKTVEQYRKKANIRWSDLDPNYHLRHTAYYDLAAQFRTEFLYTQGLSVELFLRHKINPILLREEGVFRREVRYGQDIEMLFELKSLSEDGLKYEIIVSFFRCEDNILCASVTILGAWLDLSTRKLTPPPAAVAEIIEKMPKHKDFEQKFSQEGK